MPNVERPAIDHRPPIVERSPIAKPSSNVELPSIGDWSLEKPPPSLFDLERRIEATRDDLRELYLAVQRIDADLEHHLRSRIRDRIIEQRAMRRTHKNSSTWKACAIHSAL